jgi:hypothetical protein
LRNDCFEIAAMPSTIVAKLQRDAKATRSRLDGGFS